MDRTPSPPPTCTEGDNWHPSLSGSPILLNIIWITSTYIIFRVLCLYLLKNPYRFVSDNLIGYKWPIGILIYENIWGTSFCDQRSTELAPRHYGTMILCHNDIISHSEIISLWHNITSGYGIISPQQVAHILDYFRIFLLIFIFFTKD